MELVADPETQEWLAAGEFGFDWDAGNSGKSERKHGVSDATFEDVFLQPFILAGRIVREGETRWLVLGKAGTKGRGYAVIFARRGNDVRPISCRPMRDEEAVRYEQG